MTHHPAHIYRWKLGDTGPAVAEIRFKLALLGLLSNEGPAAQRRQLHSASSLFDLEVDEAVRYFQQQRGLTSDGIVGPETYRHLNGARWRLGDRTLAHTSSNMQFGDDVAQLQQRLLDMGFTPGRVDGIFGPATAQALSEFQRNGPPAGRRARPRHPDGPVATRPDGRRRRPPRHAGDRDAAALRSRTGRQGRRHRPRAWRQRRRGLRRRDQRSRGGLGDRRSLEQRLQTLGVRTHLTRQADSGGGDESRRAAFANATEADLLISLHLEGHHNPIAAGVASYY